MPYVRSPSLCAFFKAAMRSVIGEACGSTTFMTSVFSLAAVMLNHIEAGTPAMIYFSSAPVRPDSVDEGQYRALRGFRETAKNTGSYETYESIGRCREKLARQLTHTMIRNILADADVSTDNDAAVSSPSMPTLSDPAKRLLIETSLDPNGHILMVRYLGGMSVQTNGKNFIEQGNPRSAAMWEGAVHELCELTLLQERGNKGEVFGITDQGYCVADAIRGSE